MCECTALTFVHAAADTNSPAAAPATAAVATLESNVCSCLEEGGHALALVMLVSDNKFESVL
jgi:hypothetical protein